MKEIIEKNFYLYGFYPLLLLIDHLEKHENFEACAEIMRVLKEKSIEHGVEYPTRNNAMSKEFFYDCFAEIGMNGDVAMANNSYYAEIILGEIVTFVLEN